MMKRVLNIYKPVGVTPLQLIAAFKFHHTEYKDAKLGYAGRLDPMADGVLLVLVGEENKKRKQYEELQKTYSFDCLFGITTDTADTLGIITKTTPDVSKKEIVRKLPNVLEKIIQKTSQQYPAYSSRTVNGKPLYYWARQNKLDATTIPSHPITVFELRLIKLQTIPQDKLEKYILEHIQKVIGDFRQKEILKGWEQFFKDKETNFIVATCSIHCSSGTYVRSICDEMGKQLGVGTLALRITREAVGSYMRKDSLRVQ